MTCKEALAQLASAVLDSLGLGLLAGLAWDYIMQLEEQDACQVLNVLRRYLCSTR